VQQAEQWWWWGVAAPLEVFIDTACELRSAGDTRAVNHTPIDVLDVTASSRLSRGGILFIGVRTSDGRPSIPALRDLRQQSPSLIIVLAAPRKQASAVPLSRWCKAGVDELIALDLAGYVREVKQLIEVRRRAPPPTCELEQLRAEWPLSWVRDALLHAWRNTHEFLALAEWTRRFGRSPRCFRDDMKAAGLPQPRYGLSIGRLLHEAELTDRQVTSRAERATRLGFNDTTQMRKKKWQFTKAAHRDQHLEAFISIFPRLILLLGADHPEDER
jgi:hypothetical protein